MALSSTDPKVLMAQAKCFSCLSPHQHLQVQTYLLAVIAGLSTSATGVQILSAASTCFSCLTKVELIRLKQYLMATWLGLDTSKAGIQTLVKAASCVPCLTPRQQQLVQTYLLTVSAGLPTNSTGVQSIEAGAKCFACLLTKRQYEVQVYILAGLSGATYTIPADLVSAAKCFESCLPFELEEILQTSLIAQAAGRLTPPCITPSAPILSAGAKVITDTTLRISWNQISNSGSLITSYTVFWGTASGVYTNSAVVPVIPRIYTITGLTSGTQYFFAVQANSSAAVGCQSALSNESNATTTGASPSNHLLVGLISYWKFDVNVSPYADSVGTNDLTGSNTSAGLVAGIINGGLDASLGSAQASHVSNADFAPGANISLSFSIWISASNWGGAGGFTYLVLKGDETVANAWAIFDNGPGLGLTGSFRDSTGTAFPGNFTAGDPTNNVFHHFVLVFDSPNSQVRGYFDGVLKFTNATGTQSILNNATGFTIGPRAGHTSIANLTMDEAAMWHKALTQADVTNLFNGGACLPLSGYQA